MPIEIKILIIVISVIIGIFLIFVLPMLLVTFPIAKKLYKKDWIRSEEGTLFPRGCSAPEIDYHLDMFNQGMKWREDNIGCSNKSKCARETGLNRNTVSKWWNAFG